MVAQNYVIVIIYYTYINSVKYRKLYCDMKLYVLIRRNGATRHRMGYKSICCQYKLCGWV